MKKLTLREAVDSHKVFWTWLADETLVRKRKVHKSEFLKRKESTMQIFRKMNVIVVDMLNKIQ